MADALLHPALPFAVGALVVWPARRRAAGAVVVLVALIALLQLWQLEVGVSVTGTYLGFDVQPLRGDRLAFAFAWVFAMFALIAGVYGFATMGGREAAAALAYAGAGIGVVFAGDLLTLFIAWEIKAVAATFVIMSRRGGNAGRAGMRYLFVHLVGGKLLLAGAVWHLADTGSLAFDAFAMSPAAALILVSFLLSAAVPPLHAWLADAYPEASVAGTVFLSAYTTKSAVYALIRGFPGLELLLWLGVIMALYGVVYAMLQNDIRRLLAYHIVSQVGFMVAGVGIGTEAALNGATAHAYAHILYKGLLLMGAGAVLYATGRSKVSELGGLADRQRAVLALYMVGAVSISSLPLFSGFVSKELTVYAAGVAGHDPAVILLKVAAVGTWLSTGLKLPYGTWFGGGGAVQRGAAGDLPVAPVATSMYVAMGAAAGLNLLLGVWPTLLFDVLPFPVDFEPYTVAKVVEKLQILTLTAVAFWLLRRRLDAKASLSLDTDWLYRALPPRVAAAWRGRVPAPAPAPLAAALARARGAVLTRLPMSYGAQPPVVPTWSLGVVLLAAALLLLVLSLGGAP